MKFASIFLMLAGILLACGCRHYDTAPPPYACQPAGCGCAPACAPAPACNPCANPCATAAPYLTPGQTVVPRAAPYAVTPAPGTYPPPMGNPDATVPVSR